MAAFLRGKQTGMQNDLSASIRPELFMPDDQARYGINSQIRYRSVSPNMYQYHLSELVKASLAPVKSTSSVSDVYTRSSNLPDAHPSRSYNSPPTALLPSTRRTSWEYGTLTPASASPLWSSLARSSLW
ncbi:hypothetical protein LB505_000383 [Fusarium chuoi]|nr:hypothetical protein LB505_000383 [Fusarium chuoi]